MFKEKQFTYDSLTYCKNLINQVRDIPVLAGENLIFESTFM